MYNVLYLFLMQININNYSPANTVKLSENTVYDNWY
jgi:hypothetical protein